MAYTTKPVHVRYYRIYRDWYKDNPSTYYGIDNTSASSLYRTNVISGSSNPEWKYQIAKKQDATTGYTRDWLEFTQPVLEARGAFPLGSRIRESTVRTSYFPHTSSTFSSSYYDASVDDIALKRIKNKLANRLGNAQLMAPLVEMRELSSAIKAITASTTSLVQKLLTIQSEKKGKEALKFASAAWLSYSFGIKPLVNDVNTAISSVQGYLNRRRANIRVAGSAKFERFVNYNDNCSNPGLFAGHVCFSLLLKGVYSCRYVAGIDSTFQCSNDYGIGDHLGFTYKELIPTFWELVPYSWIVDYFTTVGDYLGDTFVLPSGSTIYVVKTTRHLLTGQAIAAIPKYDMPYCISLNTTPGLVKYACLKRTKLAALPHAALRIKIFDEIGKNAVDRLLNLASVLISRRKI